MRSFLRSIWATAGIILLFTALAAAQVSPSTGAIRGVVTDPNGQVVVGATVTLTNPSLAVSRQTTTGGDGSFAFGLLKPADGYQVEIQAQGFEKQIVSKITVKVTETTDQTITLSVGAVSQEVTVTSETQVQTSSATLGGVLGSRVVTALPLPTRSVLDLLGTDAGVAATLTSPSATILQGSQALLVGGARAVQNNYTLNGVDANNFEFHTLATGIVPVPNPDAVQEFRTQTSLYDATMGFSGGGNIALVTKSGTSDIHGGAYEFYRSSALNANDFFFNKNGVKKPFLNQNQFGGYAGGPFPGKKTFWFADYEGYRQVNGVAGGITTFMPVLPSSRDAASLANAFGVPVSAIDPVAVKLLNLPGPYNGFLIPSGTGAPVGQLGNFAFSSPVKFTSNQFNGKVDHDGELWGRQNHISVSAFVSRGTYNNPGGVNGGGLGQGFQYPLGNDSYSINDTTILRSNLLNDFTFGFTWNKRDISSIQSDTINQIGMSRFNSALNDGLPNIIFFDQASCCGYQASVDQTQRNASFDVRDMVSWIKGKHSLRFGFETRSYQFNYNVPLDRGTLVFGNIFADSLYGTPSNPAADLSIRDLLIGAPVEVAIGSGLNNFGYRSRDYVGFAQDDFHVTRRLTLNLGIRYDFLGNVREVHDHIANFDPSLVSASALKTGGAGLGAGFITPAGLAGFGTPGVSNSTLLNSDKNNFAPRISFAYDVFGTGKLAVRGGYGIYYIRNGGGGPLQTLSDPPFSINTDMSGFLGTGVLSNPFPTLPLPSQFPIFPNFPTLTGFSSSGAPTFSDNLLSVSTLDRHMHTPYEQQWNLTVQYQFLPKWMVEVGYLGSHSIGLLATQSLNNALLVNSNNPGGLGLTTNSSANRNARVPVVGFDANGIFAITGAAKSMYDALLLTVSHDFAHGLYFKAAYTFSKNLDNYPQSSGFDIGGTNVGNQFINDLNYGLSNFDIRHRLVITYAYDLPGPKKGILSKVLGGWSLNGIATLQSGLPGTITQSIGDSSLSGTAGYGVLIPGCQLVTGGSVQDHLNNYLNSACVATTSLLPGGTVFGPLSPYEGPGDQNFTITPGGSGRLQGPSTRGAFRAPFQKRWDASVVKHFKTNALGENGDIEFRAEFFKITNTPIFSGPSATVGSVTFGRITSTIDGTGRQIQFGLKLHF